VEDEKESDEESRHEEESPCYPKVDMNLPELLPEQKALIDTWWRETKPYFKKNDADEMLRRVLRFMEDWPKLFVHLGLEHEFLFELGAELGRRRQWSWHAELLRRIRIEHPEMYVRAFSQFPRGLRRLCRASNGQDQGHGISP
jgi:ribulose bisphosphate carboxylase small subunit